MTTYTTGSGVLVNTANDAHISGTSGNDKLEGTGGNDLYYGGAGNDTFIVTAASLAASTSVTNGIHAEAVIYDFGGAGGWSATNNDFLALEGFGAGSTLTFARYGGNADGSANTTYQYYTVHSASTGADYTIFVHSVDGKLLGAGDYNFYG